MPAFNNYQSETMTQTQKFLLFVFFLLSGFCGLVYQVVWIRLAYASFGVITPVLSVIISVFMLGLALGSWLGGKTIDKMSTTTGWSALIFYGICEALIATGAFIVPKLFQTGQTLLFTSGPSHSFSYLFVSAVAMSSSILPWCFLMGCTFPFMMAYVKEQASSEMTSFSFLYCANVIGAAFGAFCTAFVLIELLGFRKTLLIAALLNLFVAAGSVVLSRLSARPERTTQTNSHLLNIKKALPQSEKLLIFVLLFSTGFISMSMEVVWVRAFAPVLGQRTYSFAALLIAYLLATWIGSTVYRRHASNDKVISTDTLLLGLAVFSFLPIVMNDPRPALVAAPIALISIIPFCAALGYLTPYLIDRYSEGNPYRGGKAYGINVLGSILGPLVAAYLLLPYWGVKLSLFVLAVPFIFFVFIFYGASVFKSRLALVMITLAIVFCTTSFTWHNTHEEKYAQIPGAEVRRDYVTTVVSMGTGMDRVLVVGGEGAAYLLMENKAQAHLPLIFLPKEPETALDICFGAGTAFRSLLSWGIKVTSVELVPSVADAFDFYFDDAKTLLEKPHSHVVIDDGRRFLARSKETYDVIVIDPPSPVEAAGSSLLYTEEFYELIKSRLNEGGVLQQWIPHTEAAMVAAATRSIERSFPYIKIYRSFNGWGHHYIASERPLVEPDLEEIISKIPEKARHDLMEWTDEKDISDVIAKLLAQEVPIQSLTRGYPEVTMTDDRPINEYYFLRRVWAKITEGHVRYTN